MFLDLSIFSDRNNIFQVKNELLTLSYTVGNSKNEESLKIINSD